MVGWHTSLNLSQCYHPGAKKWGLQVSKKLQQEAKQMELEKMRGFKADLDKQVTTELVDGAA